MPAHRVRRATGDLIDRNLPWPSTLLGVVLLLILFLSGLAILAGTAPTVTAPSMPAPTASVVITPDDPAAPTPVPANELGR